MYRAIITHIATNQDEGNRPFRYPHILTLEWKDDGRFKPFLAFTYRTLQGEFALTRDKALFMSEEDAIRATEESLQALGHQAVEQDGNYTHTYQIEVLVVTDLPAGLPIHGMKANPNSSTFWFLTEEQEYLDGVNRGVKLPQGFGSYVKTNGMSPWDPRHPQSFNYTVPNDRFRFE